MREQGYSLESLSMIYLLGLFWVFKFLWAPIIDRWKLPGQGHFRSWLLLLQFLMVVVLLVISQQPLDGSFTQLFLYCMLLAFLSATQDIAADGLSCSLSLPTERGVGNGVQSAGGLIGNMLGGGGVLMLYPWLGWENSLYLLALGTSVSLLLLFFFREPDTRPVAQGVGNVFRYIHIFWKQPNYGGWLRLLLIFPAVIGLAYGLLAAWLWGWSWLDPAIALVASFVILRWAVGLLKQTASVLLDMEEPDLLRNKVNHQLDSMDGVRVVDLHLWSVGQGTWTMVASLVTHDAAIIPDKCKALLEGIDGLYHPIIEINYCPTCHASD